MVTVRSHVFALKYFLALFVLFASLFPTTAYATSTTFDAYQRVKNITAGDASVGSVYTLGQPGDELRYLVFVYNRENYERTYDLDITLPHYLTYTASSTEQRTDDGWRQTSDITNGYTVRLTPFTGAYVRYTARVATDFPNENQILTTISRVTETTHSESRIATTKVYVPHFAPSATTTATETSDTDRTTTLLEEERKFMEAAFAELTSDATNVDVIPATPVASTTNTETVRDGLWESIAAVIVLTIVFYAYQHLRRPR